MITKEEKAILKNLEESYLNISDEDKRELFHKSINDCEYHLGKLLSKKDVRTAILNLIFTGIKIDGKYTEKEQLLVKDWFISCGFQDSEMGEINQFIESFKVSEDQIKACDNFIDQCGEISMEIKGLLIIVFIIIASIDNEMSEQEEDFIVRLLR